MVDASARRLQLETSATLLAAGVSKPVFGCRWPETRRIAARLWRELPEGLAERLYGAPYHGGQDGLHEDFLEAWLSWRREVVTLDESMFPHRYATAGSSEAIRECIAQFSIDRRSASREPVIHLFDGEYEGYCAYADAYGVRIVRHDRGRWRESFHRRSRDAFRGDLVMVSQPSAMDGNVWAELPDLLRHLEDELPDVRVAVDLAYVGTVARAYEIAVISPLIDTIFFSLSKVFGVYYHRIGGVLSRQVMPGLVGNRWFKNTYSLELGRELLATLPPRAIPAMYATYQATAAADAGRALGLPLVASDAALMAHHSWRDDLPAVVAGLRRGETVRYCLTPSLDRLLAGQLDDAIPVPGARP
jgi:hypothetical protein